MDKKIMIPEDYMGMANEVECPKCKSNNTYGSYNWKKGFRLICGNCGHKWKK